MKMYKSPSIKTPSNVMFQFNTAYEQHLFHANNYKLRIRNQTQNESYHGKSNICNLANDFFILKTFDTSSRKNYMGFYYCPRLRDNFDTI